MWFVRPANVLWELARDQWSMKVWLNQTHTTHRGTPIGLAGLQRPERLLTNHVTNLLSLWPLSPTQLLVVFRRRIRLVRLCVVR